VIYAPDDPVSKDKTLVVANRVDGGNGFDIALYYRILYGIDKYPTDPSNNVTMFISNILPNDTDAATDSFHAQLGLKYRKNASSDVGINTGWVIFNEDEANSKVNFSLKNNFAEIYLSQNTDNASDNSFIIKAKKQRIIRYTDNTINNNYYFLDLSCDYYSEIKPSHNLNVISNSDYSTIRLGFKNIIIRNSDDSDINVTTVGALNFTDTGNFNFTDIYSNITFGNRDIIFENRSVISKTRQLIDDSANITISTDSTGRLNLNNLGSSMFFVNAINFGGKLTRVYGTYINQIYEFTFLTDVIIENNSDILLHDGRDLHLKRGESIKFKVDENYVSVQMGGGMFPRLPVYNQITTKPFSVTNTNTINITDDGNIVEFTAGDINNYLEIDQIAEIEIDWDGKLEIGYELEIRIKGYIKFENIYTASGPWGGITITSVGRSLDYTFQILSKYPHEASIRDGIVIKCKYLGGVIGSDWVSKVESNKSVEGAMGTTVQFNNEIPFINTDHNGNPFISQHTSNPVSDYLSLKINDTIGSIEKHITNLRIKYASSTRRRKYLSKIIFGDNNEVLQDGHVLAVNLLKFSDTISGASIGLVHGKKVLVYDDGNGNITYLEPENCNIVLSQPSHIMDSTINPPSDPDIWREDSIGKTIYLRWNAYERMWFEINVVDTAHYFDKRSDG
jgi:hypothetical protein